MTPTSARAASAPTACAVGSAGGLLDSGIDGAAGKPGGDSDRQGGCGCRVPAEPDSDTGAGWLLLLGLGLVVTRRERTRSRRKLG